MNPPADPTGESAALAERLLEWTEVGGLADGLYRDLRKAAAALRSVAAQGAGESLPISGSESIMGLSGLLLSQPSDSSTAGREVEQAIAWLTTTAAKEADLTKRLCLSRAAALLQRAPEPADGGWRLVPVKPTEAMVAAGGEGLFDCSRNSSKAGRVWSAMLAAAPPTAQGDTDRTAEG